MLRQLPSFLLSIAGFTAFIETTLNVHVDICGSCVTIEIHALLCKIPVSV